MKSYALTIPEELHQYLTSVANRRNSSAKSLLAKAITLVLTIDAAERKGETLWVRNQDSGELVQLDVFGERKTP